MTQQELIGQRVNQLGMSWYAVSKATGINEATLTQFKHGKFQFRDDDKLAELAEVLMLNLDDLHYAAGRLPPEVHNGLIHHPELLPILRTLLTKVGYLNS